MAIPTRESLARKAQALQARLTKQRARLVTAGHHSGRVRIRSGVASAAFSDGANLGAAIFGRPKSSIRGKSPEGMTSFHFQLTPVSRGSEFTNRLAGRTSSKADGTTTSAASHQIYIERDQAVETIAKDGLQSKVALEADPMTIGFDETRRLLSPDDPGYAASAAAYIDRDGAVENRSSFGNIAGTVEDRIAFWRAVEMAERRPLKHKITINAALDPEFWKIVENDAGAPQFLKKIVQAPPTEILEDNIAEKDALKIQDYFLKNRTVSQKDAQPIAFTPGRGGRVQYRLVVDLPADMSPEQRLEIARSFCDQQFDQKGAPFHCAIHRPTKSNDERHYHMHITFHDRPAARAIDPGTGAEVWDFEILKRKKDSSRHYSETRPNQQDKIRELQAYNWPREARKNFAEIVNAIRKKNGMPSIYDHRKYSGMGVGYEVLPTLTRAEFHDIQRGVENPRAAAKIEKRWLRAMLKAADETTLAEPNKATTKRFVDLIANVRKRAPASVVAAKAAHGAYLEATKRINDARLDRAALRVAVDKEISAITPEIGAMLAGAKKEKAEIEKLHDHLAKPFDVHEALARESQRLAVLNLAMLEHQLKTVSRGSLSLPGRSFNNLISTAGLTNVFRSIQSAADEILVPKPIITPPPARTAYVAPPVTKSVKTTPIQPSAPTRTFEEAPVHRPILVDPQPWRLAKISRTVAPQQSVTTQSKSPIQVPMAVQPRPIAQSTSLRQPPPAPAKAAETTTAKKAAMLGPTAARQPAMQPVKPAVAIAPKSAAPPAEISSPAPDVAEGLAKGPDQHLTPSFLPNDEEDERLKKERRQKRRAIITNPPHPQRGRGGHER